MPGVVFERRPQLVDRIEETWCGIKVGSPHNEDGNVHNIASNHTGHE